MGKVLSTFQNGFSGAVSRSADNVIISLRNASGAEVAFGSPMFAVSGERACRAFNSSSSTPETFVGFAVRIADKTPETYDGKEGVFRANEPTDVLVRGSVVLKFESAALPGNSVYIRKADGKLVTSAGSEGTTIQLPGCTVATARDAGRCAEVVLTSRNLL